MQSVLTSSRWHHQSSCSSNNDSYDEGRQERERGRKSGREKRERKKERKKHSVSSKISEKLHRPETEQKHHDSDIEKKNRAAGFRVHNHEEKPEACLLQDNIMALDLREAKRSYAGMK